MQGRDGAGRIPSDKDLVGVDNKRIETALTRNTIGHTAPQKTNSSSCILGRPDGRLGKFGIQWSGDADANAQSIGSRRCNITPPGKFLAETGHHRIVSGPAHE